jgi:hypothetical protein
LAAEFTLLCSQYQLIGESLKRVGEMLSHPVGLEELKACAGENSEETTKTILSKFLVLRVPQLPPLIIEDKDDKKA